MKSTYNSLILAVLSGVLLALPWLVPHTGVLLLFAFVPLLWMEHLFAQEQRKGAWKYYALTFFIWNALTVFWVCWITVPGGIFAVLGNAFQMFFVFALFRLVKKGLSRKKGWDGFAYVFLASAWLAWEYLYFDAEISFPWLVLGNGFATSFRFIQWYEVTGALGGSLWVWICNILFLYVLKGTHPLRMGSVALCVILLPIAASLIRFYTYQEPEQTIEVVVLQPNIDPTPGADGVSEKFGGMSEIEQAKKLLNLGEGLISQQTTYVFAPETCIQNVKEGSFFSHPALAYFDSFFRQFPNTSFVFGASTYAFYPNSSQKPTPSARRYGLTWYDAFNTAIQLDRDSSIQGYHKSKLVVGAEKMPFVDKIPLIEKMALNLGGTTGTLGTQPERTVFVRPDKAASVGVAICYESIYGDFVTEYVKKGASLLAVITNDGWWGDTPGYKQHVSYASLRAIETRRSIARSANTGISALINPRGERLSQTDWWVAGALKGNLPVNTALTPYVRYGDWIGPVGVVLSAALLLLSLLLRLFGKRKVPQRHIK